VKKSIFQVVALFVLVAGCATVKTLNDDQLKANLKKHISTLASDKFEGREPGTKGEQLAADYIISQFKDIGLKPMGEKKFIQEFPFNQGVSFGKSTQLYVNMNSYKVNTDFYPLPFSADTIVTGYIARVGYGIYAPLLRHNDYQGKVTLYKKIFVMESTFPEGNDPGGKYGDYDLRHRVEEAKARGAIGVIFINSDTTAANPQAGYLYKSNQASIPVIFAKGSAAKLLKEGVVSNCTVGVDVQNISQTGHNVIGYLDNDAATTVVIGAHYDHLGYGGDGSLYRGNDAAIHNGADDNASGTAALIEVARALKASTGKKNNYLFIAFSGEEKGLLGSDYFIKHPTIDLRTVNYMLNMDQVGRLKSDDLELTINGTGTSPSWKNVLDTLMFGIKIKTSPSGVGHSDHTSFYLDSIPALHFYSGMTSDYHQPSDDEDKINYDGEASIIKIVLLVIDRLDKSGKISFTKTTDRYLGALPRSNAALGIIPDPTYKGEGVRIDALVEMATLEAGLQKGDVIIQLGENRVTDINSYMKALEGFTKGQTIIVKLKRGNEELQKQIIF